MSKQQVTRREFAARLGALPIAGTEAAAARPAPAKRPACLARGIVGVTRRSKALDVPPSTPAGATWRYQLAYPFQVAARLAALSCNIKPNFGPGQDWENGLDLVLFDDLDRIRTDRAISVTRNHEEPNPNASGKTAVMVKYPGPVGFVPREAKRGDGKPHPHAGTGFLTSSVHARPTDDSEGLSSFPDRVGRGSYTGSKAYDYFELFQLAYDGRKLDVARPQRIGLDELLPGWIISGGAMTNPIPDGDDLIVGARGEKPGRTAGCGLLRWRRSAGAWRAVDFSLITPEDNSIEPSVIRDGNGDLLYLARGRRETGPPVRVWRSRDGGRSWERTLFVQGLVGSVPISLNQAVDGTPYIASNIFTPWIKVPGGDGGISRLEPAGGRGERSMLCLWPLNEQRNGLEAPLVARDCLTEFGVPPSGTVWAADHPSARTVQLSDGEWHHLICYRLLDWKENTHFIAPSPRTGGYVEEVFSVGEPVAPWSF